MPHLDDGTLHALIDGALAAEAPERAVAAEDHLAACADCRARLKAAAELRSRAGEVLDAALPDTALPDDDAAAAATPDFDEVLARAGMGSRRRRLRRQLGWTRGLAWAATVVLALGTGYLIRDLAGPVGPDLAPVREAPVQGDGAGAGDRAATPGPAGGATRRTVDEEEAVAEAAPPPAAEPRARAETPAGAANADEADDAPETADAAEGAGAVDASEREVREAETETLQGARGAAALLESAAPDVPAPAPAPTPAPEDPGEARWTAITVDEARAGLDGPLYVLPRAELLDVFARDDVEPMEVMSRQRLESGIAIRVVQRRVDIDSAAAGAPAADAPAADAPSVAGRDQARLDRARRLGELETARVTRGPFVLEVSGPVPAELLEILAGAARPSP